MLPDSSEPTPEALRPPVDHINTSDTNTTSAAHANSGTRTSTTDTTAGIVLG